MRADGGRVVTFRGRAATLHDLAGDPDVAYRDVREADGSSLRVTTPRGAGRVQVAEARITLDRPSTRRRDGRRISLPAPHLTVRLVVGRVVDGRQMKSGVESTAPALLAGLDKLLALEALRSDVDLDEVLSFARRVLPHLFRSG